MAKVSLEEIIASNPRFRNLDIAKVRKYYEDAMRQRNATQALPEIVVTAPSVHKQATEARAALKQKQMEEGYNDLMTRISLEDGLIGAYNAIQDRRIRKAENRNIANNIAEYDNMPAYNAAINHFYNDPKFIHSRNTEAADKQVRNTAFSDDKTVNLMLNSLSPSQQIGAIIDGFQGEGYLNSLRNGNSGIFTDAYAVRHPNLTSGANLLFDVGSGIGASKLLNGANVVKGINAIDKNIRNVPRTLRGFYNRNIKRPIRRYKNFPNYNRPSIYDDYKNAIANQKIDYALAHGTPTHSITDRARGIRDELYRRNAEIRTFYKKDSDFLKYRRNEHQKLSDAIKATKNSESIENIKLFNELLDNHPEYLYYCFREGLDYKDINTVRQFIKRQSRSIRGIAESPDTFDAELFTKAFKTSPTQMKGGDLVQSNGGLYTSNSGKVVTDPSKEDKIAGRFATPINRFYKTGKGDIGIIETDFGVNPDAPILEQLQQFKNHSIDYDVINARAISPTDVKGEIDEIPALSYKRDPSVIATQHPYMSDGVFERILLSNKDKSVGRVVDHSRTYSPTPRQNRWDYIDYDYDDGLFLPYAPPVNLRSLLRYSRLKHKYGDVKLTDNILNAYREMDNIANRRINTHKSLRQQYERTYDRINKAKAYSPLAGLGLGIAGAIGYGVTGYADIVHKHAFNDGLSSLEDDIINNGGNINNYNTWSYSDRQKYEGIVGINPKTYNIFNDTKDEDGYKNYDASLKRYKKKHNN